MSLKSGKLSLALAVGAMATAAVVPAAASAEPQEVTGTTLAAALAIAPSPAAFASGFGTVNADTTGGGVSLTAIGAWNMRVSGTDAGKLRRTLTDGVCAGSTNVLNNALGVFPTATLGNFTAGATTGAPLALSATATSIATGIGSNVVTLTYRHNASASDQLTAACPYSMTATVAIAAT